MKRYENQQQQKFADNLSHQNSIKNMQKLPVEFADLRSVHLAASDCENWNQHGAKLGNGVGEISEMKIWRTISYARRRYPEVSICDRC